MSGFDAVSGLVVSSGVLGWLVEGVLPNEIAQNGFCGQGLGEWKQITIRNELPLDLAAYLQLLLEARQEEEKRYDASHPVPLFSPTPGQSCLRLSLSEGEISLLTPRTPGCRAAAVPALRPTGYTPTRVRDLLIERVCRGKLGIMWTLNVV